MSNPYIAKEVAKIIEEKKGNYPDNVALASAWVMAHFKGVNIKIYDAKKSSSLCDYNVIASAENTTQAKAMVDELVRNFKEHGLDIVSLEGMGDAEWILLDAGDIIVHIFQEISRDIFDLDSLWHEAEQLAIPQEYYFGKAEEAQAKKETADTYF